MSWGADDPLPPRDRQLGMTRQSPAAVGFKATCKFFLCGEKNLQVGASSICDSLLLFRVVSLCIHGKAEVVDGAGAVDACVGRVPCVLDGPVD